MRRRRAARRTTRRVSRRTGRRAGGRLRRRAGPARRGFGRPARQGIAQGLKRRRRRRLLVGGAVLLAAGGAAYAAYKLSRRDAERVEQHTGIPPEELTDEELERAMADLNIQGMELDEEDYQALDAEQRVAGATPPPATEGSYLDELERLAAFRDQGVLTEEEFQAKKGQLLGL